MKEKESGRFDRPYHLSLLFGVGLLDKALSNAAPLIAASRFEYSGPHS